MGGDGSNLLSRHMGGQLASAHNLPCQYIYLPIVTNKPVFTELLYVTCSNWYLYCVGQYGSEYTGAATKVSTFFQIVALPNFGYEYSCREVLQQRTL